MIIVTIFANRILFLLTDGLSTMCDLWTVTSIMRAKDPHHCGTARCKHASPEQRGASLYTGYLARSNTIAYTSNLDLVHASLAHLRSGRQAFPSLPFDGPYNKPASTVLAFSAFATTISDRYSDYMAASPNIPLNLQWIFMLDYDIRNSRVARLLVDTHKLVDLYRVRRTVFASFGRSGQWQMSGD
jgi:hypothetical protein